MEKLNFGYILAVFLLVVISAYITWRIRPWEHVRQERQTRRRIEDAVHLAMSVGILTDQTFFVSDDSGIIHEPHRTDHGSGFLVRRSGPNEFWVAGVKAGEDLATVWNYKLFRMDNW